MQKRTCSKNPLGLLRGDFCINSLKEDARCDTMGLRGDDGNLENPPINVERLNYLRELITFFGEMGIQAIDNAPKIN